MDDILIKSRILNAFPHGFTTRRGGSSVAPYTSLNLGGSVGDDPAAVTANWKTLESLTGLGFARVRQVHGSEVVIATAAMAPEAEADAVATHSPGVAAAVSVADCVPILIADPRSVNVGLCPELLLARCLVLVPFAKSVNP